MSPIGRVFIVLNLLLAGTFVGFAGTYLQRQDNWRDKFVAEKEYAGGVRAFLFRDKEGRSLQVLWANRGRHDVAIPLAEVGRFRRSAWTARDARSTSTARA